MLLLSVTILVLLNINTSSLGSQLSIKPISPFAVTEPSRQLSLVAALSIVLYVDSLNPREFPSPYFQSFASYACITLFSSAFISGIV